MHIKKAKIWQQTHLEDDNVASIIQNNRRWIGGVFKDKRLVAQIKLHWQSLRHQHAHQGMRGVDLYVQCFEIVALKLAQRFDVALKKKKDKNE